MWNVSSFADAQLHGSQTTVGQQLSLYSQQIQSHEHFVDGNRSKWRQLPLPTNAFEIIQTKSLQMLKSPFFTFSTGFSPLSLDNFKPTQAYFKALRLNITFKIVKGK